jgi:hypothetical protein
MTGTFNKTLKELEEELDEILSRSPLLKSERELPKLEEYMVNIKDYWPEGDDGTEEADADETGMDTEYLPDYIAEEAEKIKDESGLTVIYPSYAPPLSVYYNNLEIRKVPRFKLGYNVLGRAFPSIGLIEIADDLYGQDFQEVKTHEMLHIKHPEKTEYEVRQLTRLVLPFSPKWH